MLLDSRSMIYYKYVVFIKFSNIDGQCSNILREHHGPDLDKRHLLPDDLSKETKL